jgi:hypothetical protein
MRNIITYADSLAVGLALCADGLAVGLAFCADGMSMPTVFFAMPTPA